MNSPPTTLGKYQIIREIARSNDIVYEAYDPEMDRRVAIKELAIPAGSSGPQQEDRVNRFKREAKAVGALNHPNVMIVYDVCKEGDRTFMPMEYLDGGTLRNEIDTKGFIPVERAIEIATSVLQGLSHAHSKGVIHRDIKPDNIQILSNGTIKITDFGIARLTFQENLTMDGQVFGTPSYMSPEQVVGKDIDQRSDLFSVGVLLYEMIAGQKPFSGDSVVSITYAIMNAEPAQPAQADYALWQVIKKALDKTTQMRYANADEMIRALKDAHAAVQSGIAGAVSGPTPSPYGANPYMTPPPPAQAVQPVYAYNPYLAQPAMAPPSPYQTTPYQSSQYQTTPYQAPQYSYQTGPSMQPPGAFPIYYPPPPRQPLMKPETAHFVKKLCITFVLLGTLALLILVGLGAIAESFTNHKNDGLDNNNLPESVANLPANMPIHEQINTAVSTLSTKQSDGRRASVKRRISELYDKSGIASLGHADLAHAELEFRSGADMDPTNPKVWADLGFVLQKQGDAEQDMERRGSQFRDAGDDWTKAYGLEPKSDLKSKDGLAAAEAYLSYAQAVLSAGDRNNFQNARDRLYNARGFSHQDAGLEARIEDLIHKLS